MSSLSARIYTELVEQNYTSHGPAKLPILTYHRILPSPDPLQPNAITASQFEKQVKLLAAHFTLLPLEEAVWKLRYDRLPDRAAVITLDDSYRETRSIAAPILQHAKKPAISFLSTEHLYVGQKSSLMFSDAIIEMIRQTTCPVIDLSAINGPILPCHSHAHKLTAISTITKFAKYQSELQRTETLSVLSHVSKVNLAKTAPRIMMSPEEVRELGWLGLTLGGHTHSHPILTQITPEQAIKDISFNRQILQQLSPNPLRAFAYPNGKYNDDVHPSHVELIKKTGYDFAVLTNSAIATAADNPLLLPRFETNETGLRFIFRMIRMRNFTTHPAQQYQPTNPTAPSTPPNTATSTPSSLLPQA